MKSIEIINGVPVDWSLFKSKVRGNRFIYGESVKGDSLGYLFYYAINEV